MSIVESYARLRTYHAVFPRSRTYLYPPTGKRKFHNNKIAFKRIEKHVEACIRALTINYITFMYYVPTGLSITRM